MDYVLRAIASTDGASLYWAGGTVWTLKLDEAVRFKSDKAAKATAVMLSACGVIRGDAECVAFGPTEIVGDDRPGWVGANPTPADSWTREIFRREMLGEFPPGVVLQSFVCPSGGAHVLSEGAREGECLNCKGFVRL